MGKEKAIDAIGDMVYIAIGLGGLLAVAVGWIIEEADDKIWALRRAL